MYTTLIILHIVSVIAWFAGLFYLPRLFVYHTQVHYEDSKYFELFFLMESRLYRIIMNPAMILTILSAFGLLYINSFAWFKQAGWVHLKITLVLLLIGYHHFLGRCIKNFKSNKNKYSERFFRIINEIPTVLLISIIYLVKAKPF